MERGTKGSWQSMCSLVVDDAGSKSVKTRKTGRIVLLQKVIPLHEGAVYGYRRIRNRNGTS